MTEASRKSSVVASSTPRRRTCWLPVGGLLVTAAGIFIQYLAGVPGFPLIPPGPIILAAVAIIVAVVRWKWIPILGVLAGAFIAVGLLATLNEYHQFTTVTPIGPFLGAWITAIGLVGAVVAGITAIVMAARAPGR